MMNPALLAMMQHGPPGPHPLMGPPPPGLGGPPGLDLRPPGAGGPPPPDAGPAQGGESTPIKAIHAMMDAAKGYMETEPDNGDKAVMAKLLAMLQQLLAKDEQDMRGALGNPALQRVIGKSAAV